MVGLVGTYDEGLEYIWQQEQQQQTSARSGPGSSYTLGGLASSDSDTLTDQQVRSSGSSECDLEDSGSVDAAINFVDSSSSPVKEAGSVRLQLGTGGAPKVILWLGSSIGNCHREEAVAFLQQVKEKAMRPGECVRPRCMPPAPPIFFILPHLQQVFNILLHPLQSVEDAPAGVWTDRRGNEA